MSANKRNFLVGLTVIVAICIFGWMFLRFGAKTATLFAPPQAQVEIDAPRVDGLSEGSPLTYQGIVVGRIIHLDRNASGNGVTISALLSTKPPVPVNVDAKIVTTNLIGGGTSVMLELQRDSKTGLVQEPIIPAEKAPYPTLHAAYIGLNIFPAEYSNVASEISRGADAFIAISEDIQRQHLVENVNDAVMNINARVTHAEEMLKSIQDILGDPSVQQDLRQTITNMRQATADIARISAQLNTDLPRLSSQASGVMTDADAAIVKAQGRIDELSKQLNDGLARASILIDSLHSISEKIDKGQGTAGLVLNDPKLYQSAVDSVKELNADLLDMQRLVAQWEQEGLSLKLK